MAQMPNLKSAREFLSHKGLLFLFGSIYLVSQGILAITVEPLGVERMLGLQVTGFTPEVYRQTFAVWEAEGVMQFYHAHLIFDDIHWIWYTIFLSVALALSLDAARLPDQWNIVLPFPLVAGLCDWFENGLQQQFLSADGYQMVIAPLTAISTTASIIKWILAIGTIFLILGIQLSRLRSEAEPKG